MNLNIWPIYKRRLRNCSVAKFSNAKQWLYRWKFKQGYTNESSPRPLITSATRLTEATECRQFFADASMCLNSGLGSSEEIYNSVCMHI